jgi:hypothetical protein
MSIFTWTTTLGGDWNTASDWSPATVPDADTAVAVLPGEPGTGYTLTIGQGESDIVNAITLGDFVVGNNGPTLEIAGTLTFAGTSPSLAFKSGSLRTDTTGVIDGSGVIGTGPQGAGVALVNKGTLHADAGSGTQLAVLVGFTNSGTVLADNGNIGIEGPTGLTNLSGTTLTGGTWIAQGPTAGTFNQIEIGFNFNATIAVDAANIELSGAASDIQGFAGGTFQPLEQQLQSIAATGTLQLLNDRGYTTANTLTDSGSLVLQGGTLTTGGLTVNGTGALLGFGVVSGSMANQASIIANGGVLDIRNTVAGSGEFATTAGSALVLNGGTAGTLNNQGAVFDASGLLDIAGAVSGSGSLVVDNKATIEIGVPTTQNVRFSGSDATLRLDNFAAYSGTLVGFARSDTLVLAGATATTAFVSNNTLVVMDNASTIDAIAVAGSYAPGASFNVQNSGGAAFVANVSGAPLQQDFPFSVTLNDTVGLTTTEENNIVSDLSAAALDWSQYITGFTTLRIDLNIVSGSAGSELANAGPTEDIPIGITLDGRTLDEPSSLLALTTGNYVPGLGSDITVNLLAGNLGSIYVNPSPTPTPGGSVPAGEFDLVTVFRHELGHGLGFGGLTNSNGVLGSQETLFDHYIQNNADGSAQFIGPTATAEAQTLFGSPIVQLTTLANGEGYAHFANSATDPTAHDLMSGLGLSPGTQVDISPMDLAVLQDAGAPVTTDLALLCFCAGTRIATPAGEVPVEQLAVEDRVVTASGVTRRIVWIGTGRVLVTPGRRSAATPVIVRKGALADNVPRRDLRVTKGHSLYLDGALIPVEFLVNHRSITWDDRAREVSIYHIELATHDVLLADGAPAESYRDDGNRWLFRTANPAWDAAPQPPCAAILTGGAQVDAIWRRLLDRAGPRPGLPLTSDPDLHLLVNGERLDAIERRAEAYVFRLSTRARSVRIRSRSAAPQELGLARDPRSLGVAVRRLTLVQPERRRVIEAADAGLVDGFHMFEAADAIRWTNGDAAVPDSLFDGVTASAMLLVNLGGCTRYPDDGMRRLTA